MYDFLFLAAWPEHLRKVRAHLLQPRRGACCSQTKLYRVNELQFGHNLLCSTRVAPSCADVYILYCTDGLVHPSFERKQRFLMIGHAVQTTEP